MVRLNSHGDRAARRLGTLLFQRTRFTVLHREFDLDDLVVVAIKSWLPAYTLLPRRTCHLLCLPIDLKAAGIKALLRLALPLVIGPRRGDEIDAVLLAALDELLGFGIVSVGQVFCREQVLLLEGPMDGRGHIHIAVVCSTRLHMGNQAG